MPARSATIKVMPRESYTGAERQPVNTHDEPSAIYVEPVQVPAISGSLDFVNRIAHRLLYDRCGSGLAYVVAHSVAAHRIFSPYGRESSLLRIRAARWSTRGHCRSPSPPYRLPARDGYRGGRACDLDSCGRRNAMDVARTCVGAWHFDRL